jgi:hypothetical protein
MATDAHAAALLDPQQIAGMGAIQAAAATAASQAVHHGDDRCMAGSVWVGYIIGPSVMRSQVALTAKAASLLCGNYEYLDSAACCAHAALAPQFGVQCALSPMCDAVPQQAGILCAVKGASKQQHSSVACCSLFAAGLQRMAAYGCTQV